MSADEKLSELLKEYPQIYADILGLFKNSEAAISWLKKPRKQLGNATPLSVLDQEPEKVADLIYRIETGDFS